MINSRIYVPVYVGVGHGPHIQPAQLVRFGARMKSICDLGKFARLASDSSLQANPFRSSRRCSNAPANWSPAKNSDNSFGRKTLSLTTIWR